MMRDHTSTQIIAKEGWKYLFFLFILWIASFIVDCGEYVVFFALLFTGFLFRNPERLPSEDDELAILAPCDGKIEAIHKEKLNGKDLIKITIKKSLLGVCLVRSPTTANIERTQRRYGLFLPMKSPLSDFLGERAVITCKSKYSDVVLSIYAGIMSRKIEMFKTIGPLKSAQRFGLLVEGSVVLYVNLDSRIKVAVGDDIRAGESVLGYFAHKGNEID
jgi:phosphatidylserine decarboxylase